MMMNLMMNMMMMMIMMMMMMMMISPRDMPPTLLLRGNQQNVLTFYS